MYKMETKETKNSLKVSSVLTLVLPKAKNVNIKAVWRKLKFAE